MPVSACRVATLLLCALALPGAASAQVYKCVGRSGTSYQSTPCAPGQATAQAWEAVEYAPPTASDLERLRLLQQPRSVHEAGRRASSPRRATPLRGASAARPASSIGACTEARQARDRELAAKGKAGRRIEVRRAADRKVAAVCR
jgi:hypothetical protein